MARPRVVKGHLAFDTLDVQGQLKAAYTVGYRLLDKHDDSWTERFSQFKENQPTAVGAGIELMARMAKKMLAAENVPSKEVTFVPALKSSESSAAPTGTLSRAAVQMAEAARSPYELELLSKRPHDSLHSQYRSREERKQIVSEACFACDPIATPYVVVVDDLITGGITLQAWADAIRSSNPSSTIIAMALAKNERQLYMQVASNNHLGRKPDTIWRNQAQ